jgi:hypothetical protein
VFIRGFRILKGIFETGSNKNHPQMTADDPDEPMFYLRSFADKDMLIKPYSAAD